VVVGLAAACGAPARVQTPAAERVGGVRLEGNHELATGELEPGLALHDAIRDGSAVDPFLLTADTERIRAAYLQRGFFAVQVTPRVDRALGRSPIVVFTVVEGRRAATRVEITGLPGELVPAEARKLVALDDGAPFDYAAYEAAKQPLAALVVNAGYAHAEVHGQVIADPGAATAVARYAITPGVRCTFGAVRIPDTTRPSLRAAVVARLAFAPGQPFSQRALDESKLAIYEIGRFSSVRILLDAPGAAGDVVDVRIELIESSRYEVHLGGGFGLDPLTYEIRGLGGFGVVPAALPLLTFATDARAAITIPHDLDQNDLLPKISAIVSLRYLDLLWPRMRGEAEVGAAYQTVEAYTWTGEHLKLGLSTPLGPRWLQLRVGWLLEDLQFSSPSDALTPDTQHRLGLDRNERLGAYQASLVVDGRDNPIEPHRGVLVDLRGQWGTPDAGGDLRFLEATPEIRGYVPLGSLVVAARLRVGAMFGDVPVTERYYAGSTDGQRGFPARRLSPLASAVVDSKGTVHTVVIGGAGMIETGIELRRRLGTLGGFPVGAELFLDGADVTDTPGELDPTNLYWAAGFGGWGKLVGDLKLRFDLGYRLNQRAPDDPLHNDHWSENLEFSIGVGEDY
jgi:translocation and assembly module TamA